MSSNSHADHSAPAGDPTFTARKRSTIGVLRRVWKYLLPYKLRALATVGCAVLFTRSLRSPACRRQPPTWPARQRPARAPRAARAGARAADAVVVVSARSLRTQVKPNVLRTYLATLGQPRPLDKVAHSLRGRGSAPRADAPRVGTGCGGQVSGGRWLVTAFLLTSCELAARPGWNKIPLTC